MLCDFCHKKEAMVHFQQEMGGEGREFHLCEACAAQNGLQLPSPSMLTDFLCNLSTANDASTNPGKSESLSTDLKCPSCGLSRNDYKKLSRLGCPDCYRTFREELAPIISGMQKGDHHVGKRPSCLPVQAEIESINRDLQEAVQKQDFEQAALLRDRITELNKKSDAAAGREKKK